MDATPLVAGIDVGGTRKGFHLVVLQGRTVVWTGKSPNPEDLVRVCKDHEVEVVAVDAPCRWGSPRHAERQLAKVGISSFSTPTRVRATASSFYEWMFNGEKLYCALAPTYPLLDDLGSVRQRCCLETYPHAITCSLLGRHVASARLKRTQRRQLLANRGIAVNSKWSIDYLDAGLCAMTAQFYLAGEFHPYGDQATGYLIVPQPRPS